MPRNKVLSQQARKIVYDVNNHIKKESEEIISSLRAISSRTSIATNSLHEVLGDTIQNLELHVTRVSNAENQPLAKLCNKLKQISKKTAEAYTCNVKNIEGIIKMLGQCQKRAALATNMSVITVRRIASEGSSSLLIPVLKKPGKMRLRTKPITGIDNFDQGVIKRCIHNFHITHKQLPTVSKLKKRLQKDMSFQGSEGSVRRIIKSLGFKWKKTENKSKLLIEGSNIRLQRIEYLQKLKKYRQEGRNIIYSDEYCLHPKAWTDNSAKQFKNTFSKDQRVLIVHAGSEQGFVENALLTFKADMQTGDYSYMTYETYEKWLTTQLLPNIPPKSVLVIDNASYHNKEYDEAPSPNSKKAVMQAWLTEKKITYSADMLKPQLYYLIKSNKDKLKKYSIDKIMAEHDHTVLRLPSYHPDLNPIDMAWNIIKRYVGSKDVTWNIHTVMDLVKEKVDAMGKQEWEAFCQTVKTIEEEYGINDHIVDKMTEDYPLRLSDDESSCADSDDDDEMMDEIGDDTDDEDNMPSTSVDITLTPAPKIKTEKQSSDVHLTPTLEIKTENISDAVFTPKLEIKAENQSSDDDSMELN